MLNQIRSGLRYYFNMYKIGKVIENKTYTKLMSLIKNVQFVTASKTEYFICFKTGRCENFIELLGPS